MKYILIVCSLLIVVYLGYSFFFADKIEPPSFINNSALLYNITYAEEPNPSSTPMIVLPKIPTISEQNLIYKKQLRSLDKLISKYAQQNDTLRSSCNITYTSN